MTDPGPAANQIAAFLNLLKTAGGFRLDYTLTPVSPAVQTPGQSTDQVPDQVPDRTPSHTETPPPQSLAGPILAVELSGPDAPLLLERNGELLHALESLAAAILRLTPEQNEQLSFDCQGFKQNRAEAIQHSATEAITRVRSTGQPFAFPPMNSRERRMLHLALAASGLPTASSGENPRRFVVLYPEGVTPQPETFAPTRPGNPRNPGNPARQNTYPTGPRSPFNRPPNHTLAQRTENPRIPAQSSSNYPEPGNPHLRPAQPTTAPEKNPNGNRADTGDESTLASEREETIRRAFRKR